MTFEAVTGKLVLVLVLVAVFGSDLDPPNNQLPTRETAPFLEEVVLTGATADAAAGTVIGDKPPSIRHPQ